MSDEKDKHRKFPRYPYHIGVEVRQSGAKTGYWGNVDDICLGGCYINTFSPLRTDTEVLLLFKPDTVEIAVSGHVVTCHPGVGMGVEFTSFVSVDGDSQLQNLLAGLEQSEQGNP